MIELLSKSLEEGVERMRYANPYTPGAGFMPSYLAGRDKLILKAQNNIAALIQRYPQQSVIYYGLRGVGKTVLLNRIEEIAEEQGILFEHIEIKEKEGFVSQITASSMKFLREISMQEKAKNVAKRAVELIKTFHITFSPKDGNITASLQSEEDHYQIITNLSDGLTDVFVALGNAAMKSEDTICFFIDEIQYLKNDELEALINAIHRVNQKRLPIMIFGAGLPKVFKELGDAKSYSERLFVFEMVDALSKEDAGLAVCEPAKHFDVEYEKDAVEKIIEVTQGYPYFIQEFCKIIWDDTTESVITLEDVSKCEEEFYSKLDNGFFRVRYDRCTQREKEFMYAMVKCGDLPCTISNVAQIMGVSAVSKISPIRAQLISKGLIYSTGYSEIDFTVPSFDKFLIRVMPEEEMGKGFNRESK